MTYARWIEKLHKYLAPWIQISLYYQDISRVEEHNDLYKRKKGERGENFGMANGMKSENRVIDLIKFGWMTAQFNVITRKILLSMLWCMHT